MHVINNTLAISKIDEQKGIIQAEKVRTIIKENKNTSGAKNTAGRGKQKI